MNKSTIKQASLSDLRKMQEKGKLFHTADAPEGEALGAEFWAKAELKSPTKKSVHLKIDSEVFDYFVSETGGKGHLTRMQQVLKAYVAAHNRA